MNDTTNNKASNMDAIILGQYYALSVMVIASLAIAVLS